MRRLLLLATMLTLSTATLQRASGDSRAAGIDLDVPSDQTLEVKLGLGATFNPRDRSVTLLHRVLTPASLPKEETDEVLIRGGSLRTRFSAQSSLSDQASSLSSDFQVGLKAFGFSGSLRSAYAYLEKTVAEEDSLYVSGVGYGNGYPLPTDTRFTEDDMKLLDSLDKTSDRARVLDRFRLRFGTHVVARVTYGAKFLIRGAARRTSSGSHRDATFAAKAAYEGIGVGGSIDWTEVRAQSAKAASSGLELSGEVTCKAISVPRTLSDGVSPPVKVGVSGPGVVLFSSMDQVCLLIDSIRNSPDTTIAASAISYQLRPWSPYLPEGLENLYSVVREAERQEESVNEDAFGRVELIRKKVDLVVNYSGWWVPVDHDYVLASVGSDATLIRGWVELAEDRASSREILRCSSFSFQIDGGQLKFGRQHITNGNRNVTGSLEMLSLVRYPPPR